MGIRQISTACTDSKGGKTLDILHPIEAEETIIGILAAGKAGDSSAFSGLSPSDFHRAELRQLFSACAGIMRGHAAVNLPNIDEWLTRNIGADRAAQLMPEVVRLAGLHHLDAWRLADCVSIVAEGARRRALIRAGEALSSGAADERRDLSDLIDRARAFLIDNTRGELKAITLADACMEAYEAAEKQIKPFPTGVAELDKVLCGGIHPGEFTILGARPAVGKTAVMLHMAQKCAEAGAKVVFVSLEMSARQMGARALAAKSDINAGLLRSGEPLPDDAWVNLAEAMNLIDNTVGNNLQILVKGGMTVEELCSEVLTLVDSKACDVLFVDYLQLLRTRQAVKGDFERLGIVSRALKGLTIDLGIAVVAAAQVLRQGNGGVPRAPSLDELRGSGDMEQDADNVLLLHVPASLDDGTLKSPTYRNQHDGLFERLEGSACRLMSVDVAKQRQGMTRRTWTVFIPSRMAFIDPREVGA